MEQPICFISYAREDVCEAHALYRRLREAGLSPWMDKPPAPYKMDGLRPGEPWEDRLREAIKSAKYFLPLFSKVSVEKSGYVQSEFRQALLKLAEIPAGKTSVIPIRIEQCGIPNARIDGISFSQYQYIDCFNGNFVHLIEHISELEGLIRNSVENKTFEVYSASEFLEAIGSNTEIVVKNEFSLSGIDVPENRHVYMREVFDGDEVVFTNLENLRIRGVGSPKIIVSPRYATVFNFENTHGVDIQGLVLGHLPDAGECQGAVVGFSHCSSINLRDSHLFGCGTYGFQLSDCEFVRFEDCQISECTHGLFTAERVTSLKLIRVKLTDSNCFSAIELRNSDVCFYNCDILNNSPNYDSSTLFKSYKSTVKFKNTTVEMGGFADLGIESDQEGLVVL